MTQDRYLRLQSESNSDLGETVRDIVAKREFDVDDYTNLPKRFVAGRSVNKIPTSSMDVDITKDRVGDVSITPTAIYYLINNAGTAQWRKVPLVTF